ncbi:MAG: hypothetical protein Fur0018_12670 [Anaerolineales bacterium]
MPHFDVECLDCGHRMPYHPMQDTCPQCGGGWMEARYDLESLRHDFVQRLQARPFNLWRYHEVLPVHTPAPPWSMGDGGTPLIRAVNLGLMLGNENIFIKDERQGPTNSFKDRQAALGISALKEAGITEAVLASTGNVAIAFSAYAARAGIKLWAFLTSLVPPEKMREVALYGTQVIKVTASYDQAKKMAAEFARQRNLYYERGSRSIPSVEGMKTIAYELAEQLTQWQGAPANGIPWRAPDWYIQAVSGGLGPQGIAKGFQELYAMGLTDKIPAMAHIQTAGCAPMTSSWQADRAEPITVDSPHTHIATLATGAPGRTYTLLYQHAKQHGGTFVSVSDEEAYRAIHIAAKMEGLSVEPATAVAFAGLFNLVRQGVIRPTDTVIINCTGHTMPIERTVLGEGWARNLVVSRHTESVPAGGPEEGLLSALNRLTVDRYPRVAIVDDTPEARRLIRRILQSQGDFTILEAENGRQAIELARREKPDLMILDLMMPEVDGFGVLDALKEDSETAEIPVIVVTAKTLTPAEKRQLRGRVHSLMQKGEFMSDDLSEEIRGLIE